MGIEQRAYMIRATATLLGAAALTRVNVKYMRHIARDSVKLKDPDDR